MVPPLAPIIIGWGLVAASLALTGRLLWTDPWTDEALIGAVLGFTLSLVLLGQVVGRMGDRSLAQGRIRRERERQERQAQREAEARARNTGTWAGRDPGQTLSVRHDPGNGLFYVRGWLGDFSSVGPIELPHPDPFALGDALGEMEKTGELEPANDEGTRAVRARLGLPAWDTGHVEVAELDPEDDRYPQEPSPEDTGVIQYTDTGLPRRPVGESLRPIDTAVFRTEVDRAAWPDRS
jgi:hypothetical protein